MVNSSRSLPHLAVAIATAATASLSAFLLIHHRRRRIHHQDTSELESKNVVSSTEYKEPPAHCSKDTQETLPGLQPIDEGSELDSNTSSCQNTPSREPVPMISTLIADEAPIFSPLSLGSGMFSVAADLSMDANQLIQVNTHKAKTARVRTIREEKRRSPYDSDAVTMITQEDLVMMNELMQLESEDEKDTFDSYRYDRKYSSTTSWS